MYFRTPGQAARIGRAGDHLIASAIGAYIYGRTRYPPPPPGNRPQRYGGTEFWHPTRVLRGRQRGVARTALEPPLKLGHPGLEPPVRLQQLADPHQQRDRGLPITIENRLRLGPLHNPEFATPERVPSGEVNAYHDRIYEPYGQDGKPYDPSLHGNLQRLTAGG